MHDAHCHDLPPLTWTTCPVLSCDRCFNQGADARIAGQSRKSNPYRRDQRIERQYRLEGWKHADGTWGVQAHWPVRELGRVT